MYIIKGVVNKVASRKLAVTAVAGAAAITRTIELTWPMAGAVGHTARSEVDSHPYSGNHLHTRCSPPVRHIALVIFHSPSILASMNTSSQVFSKVSRAVESGIVDS